MKLTISRKLLFGYLVMALLTLMASVYAVFSLRQLNNLAYEVINRDFFIVETSKKLVDNLLAQESAEGKYIILRSPSIAEIFRARNSEFAQLLQGLADLPFPGMARAHAQIVSLTRQYGELFEREVAMVGEDRPNEAIVLSENQGKKIVEGLAFQIRSIQQKAEKDIDARMNLIREQGTAAARFTVILAGLSLAAGLVLALLITYNISVPLKKLEKATRAIGQAQFDYDLRIDRHDEIGSLATAFGVMTKRLKMLEALNLDASPLTGLPGNLAIERTIEERLLTQNVFSLCQIDLDHFKPFADTYGYAWASEIIKEVAKILLTEREKANLGDVFVGHIGGDDFVLIGDPERAEALGRRLVAVFDEQIRPFYTEEDRQRGGIEAKDRKGQMQTFPLLSISVAMVTGDGLRFKNALEMAELTAELKEYAKSLAGSNLVTEEDWAYDYQETMQKT